MSEIVQLVRAKKKIASKQVKEVHCNKRWYAGERKIY